MSAFDPRTAPTAGGTPGQFDASCWTPQRRGLLEWFNRDAPSLASAYEAAVQLISSPAMPARVHLVCHIVRDIFNQLPEILDGEYRFQSTGASYPGLVDTIAEHWKLQDWTQYGEENPSAVGVASTDTVVVGVAGARAVEKLLKCRESLENQRRSTEVLAEALYRRFAEAGLDPPARLSAAFESERKWFTKRAHLVRDHAKLPTDQGLSEHFAAFEQALYSLVGQYFTGRGEIDAILDEANA